MMDNVPINEVKNMFDTVKGLAGVQYATLIDFIKKTLDDIKSSNPAAAGELADNPAATLDYILDNIVKYSPKFQFITPEMIKTAEREYLSFDKTGVRTWGEYLKRIPQSAQEKLAAQAGINLVNSYTPDQAKKIFDSLQERLAGGVVKKNRALMELLYYALKTHSRKKLPFTFADFINAQHFFYSDPALKKHNINSWLDLLRQRLPDIDKATLARASTSTDTDTELSPLERAQQAFKEGNDMNFKDYLTQIETEQLNETRYGPDPGFVFQLLDRLESVIPTVIKDTIVGRTMLKTIHQLRDAYTRNPTPENAIKVLGYTKEISDKINTEANRIGKIINPGIVPKHDLTDAEKKRLQHFNAIKDRLGHEEDTPESIELEEGFKEKARNLLISLGLVGGLVGGHYQHQQDTKMVNQSPGVQEFREAIKYIEKTEGDTPAAKEKIKILKMGIEEIETSIRSGHGDPSLINYTAPEQPNQDPKWENNQEINMKEHKTLEQQLAEAELITLKYLSGVNKKLDECGIMAAPMTTGYQGPATMNITAANGDELSSLIKNLVGVTDKSMASPSAHMYSEPPILNKSAGDSMKDLLSIVDDSDEHDFDHKKEFEETYANSPDEEYSSEDIMGTYSYDEFSPPGAAKNRGLTHHGKGHPIPENVEELTSQLYSDYQKFIAEAKKSCNMTAEGKSCPVHGMKECMGYNSKVSEGKKKAKPDFLDVDGDGDRKEPMKKALADKKKAKTSKKMSERIQTIDVDRVLEAKKKPSAGMTKAEKSEVVKKAKAGEDIGKPGKGFAEVEAAAKKSGAKDPKAVAAAAMWKGQSKKASKK